MDKIKKDLSILEHIIKYCEEIEETHTKFGDKFDNFKDDKDYFKSISMSLLQIGELANHLSKKFQEKYKSIPYSGIISLRNIVAHGYGKLKAESIWQISHENTPELQKQCLEILKETGNS